MQLDYKNISTKYLVKLANNNDQIAQQETINRFMFYGIDFTILNYIDLSKWNNFLEKCHEDQKYIFVLISFMFSKKISSEKIFHANIFDILIPLIKIEAKTGNSLAQNNLGFIYYYGIGVTINLTKGLKWFNTAANQKSIHAYNNLSTIYINCQSQDNYNRMMNNSIEGAKLSNCISEYILGDIFYFGFGAKQNYLTALEWYLKSANKSFPSAQYRLYQMYKYGYGVEKNFGIALHWLNLSAKNYYPDVLEIIIEECLSFGNISQHIYWCIKQKNMKKFHKIFDIDHTKLIPDKSCQEINFEDNGNEILSKCQIMIIQNKYNKIDEYSPICLEYCNIIENIILQIMTLFNEIDKANKSKFMISCLSFKNNEMSKKIQERQNDTNVTPYVKIQYIQGQEFINFGVENNKLIDKIITYNEIIIHHNNIFKQNVFENNNDRFESISELFIDLKKYYELLLGHICHQQTIRNIKFMTRNDFLITE
ncbi:putative Sel1-like repeat-containing protein [Cotonvirus japonicus]|uniref:Sel1-like repeat-containing protein n=1 Tax=Cotonvirus japonicus TaxID=2811091 RepID=A0ABM7NR40_9VIRU|nr:putative Sel1-like repeat-containing protein [Cotonvirus japonicus]BCS82614.1 putative Sel1-like repeat-containing protein [Cotonvirus japonicus]